MAFEKTTAEVFKRRLKAGEYADATGARRAVGKTKEMSDAEKKKAYAAIDAHPGPWGKKPEKGAAKKAAAPAAKTAKKVAKKPAAKKAAPEPSAPAAKKSEKATKGARAKRTPKTPKGGAQASDETRPSTPAASTPAVSEPPAVGDHSLTADDVVRNPLLLKNTAGDLVGSLGQAYSIAESIFKNDPSFDLGSFGQQTGEGLKKAVALANATAGGLHDAAVRAGALPGAVMTPSATPASEPVAPGSPQDVLNRSADAAEKVHGTGKYSGPGRTS